jgi:hypothetical protein
MNCFYLFIDNILPVLFEVVSGTAEEAVAKMSIKTLEHCQLTTLKITYPRAVITMD